MICADSWRPDPHGHGSLRPSFSIKSLFPFTTRSPRLTRASDGKPFLRLLVASKPELVEVIGFGLHGTPPHRLVPRMRGAHLTIGTLTFQSSSPYPSAPLLTPLRSPNSTSGDAAVFCCHNCFCFFCYRKHSACTSAASMKQLSFTPRWLFKTEQKLSCPQNNT